jgi:hypothetical protein
MGNSSSSNKKSQQQQNKSKAAIMSLAKQTTTTDNKSSNNFSTFQHAAYNNRTQVCSKTGSLGSATDAKVGVTVSEQKLSALDVDVKVSTAVIKVDVAFKHGAAALKTNVVIQRAPGADKFAFSSPAKLASGAYVAIASVQVDASTGAWRNLTLHSYTVQASQATVSTQALGEESSGLAAAFTPGAAVAQPQQPRVTTMAVGEEGASGLLGNSFHNAVSKPTAAKPNPFGKF